MDKKKAMLAAFRKMASQDAKNDMRPEVDEHPMNKRMPSDAKSKFEQIHRLLKSIPDDEDEDIKDLEVQR